MKLQITTPLTLVVDEDKVSSLRAEDASGSFGIRMGHADFLTRLEIGVIGWSRDDGVRCYCAVRRGVLSVQGGRLIAVATREAVLGDDLATLDRQVIERFRADLDTQRVEHVASAGLQLQAVRQLMRQLRARGPNTIGRFT
jgi:F-type H+-transporting ATPase subunit epsilon